MAHNSEEMKNIEMNEIDQKVVSCCIVVLRLLLWNKNVIKICKEILESQTKKMMCVVYNFTIEKEFSRNE